MPHMSRPKCLIIFLALTAVAACSFGASEIAALQKQDEKVIVEGNNEFALDLYARLRRREGNLFLSPYSISAALAMTYAGARGTTEAQMAPVLHFPTGPKVLPPDYEGTPRRAWGHERFHRAFAAIISRLNAKGKEGNFELRVANALWGQKDYGFLREYLRTVEANYGGRLTEVDFRTAAEKARVTINEWVQKKTNNRIKDIIARGTLDEMTRLVLTNAIYFKGRWDRQFEKDATAQAPFRLLSGGTTRVPMMNQTGDFRYAADETLQVLELPYVNHQLSMVILLPRQTDGLGDLEKTLTAQYLSKCLGMLRKRDVVVSIPRFKMTSRFSLAALLGSMGMKDAFSSNADFSGMNGRKDLFISAVLHKAFVEVNEEGTEAAAATAVTIELTSVRPGPTPVFRADHPFVFLIRDTDSGSILFLGRLMNPGP
jgi:serpin B